MYNSHFGRNYDFCDICLTDYSTEQTFGEFNELQYVNSTLLTFALDSTKIYKTDDVTIPKYHCFRRTYRGHFPIILNSFWLTTDLRKNTWRRRLLTAIDIYDTTESDLTFLTVQTELVWLWHDLLFVWQCNFNYRYFVFIYFVSFMTTVVSIE